MHKKDSSELSGKEVRDAITWHAYMSGMQSGAIAAAVTAVGVLTANTYWTKFRTRLGYSGKTALVVSAFLGAFTIDAETRIYNAAHNPTEYLATMDPSQVRTETRRKSTLKWHQQMANFVFDYPYRSLIMMGVPLVGGIYAYQRSNKAILPSQQVMHTRIYGQGSVVILLLAAMGFNDYMRKRGRFEEEGAEPDEEQMLEAKAKEALEKFH